MDIIIWGIVLFIVAIGSTYIYDGWKANQQERKERREAFKASRAKSNKILYARKLSSDKELAKMVEDLSDVAAEAGIKVEMNRRLKTAARTANIDRSEIEELIRQIENRKIGKKSNASN